MEIPNLTHEFFEDVYLESISDLLRISIEELKNKINSTENTSLNKKAERYVKTYLYNEINNIDGNNWLSLKETYFQWKLLEGIEKDEISKDKKKTLHELLDIYKEQAMSKNENSKSFRGIWF